MKTVTAKLILFMTLASAALASCRMFMSPDDAGVTEVTAAAFNKKSVKLAAGATEYLSLSITPGSEQGKHRVLWQYDASKIAIHEDTYGVLVSALAAGNTYIKATVEGISTTCIITIEGDEIIYNGVPYIYSNISVIQMKPGTVETVSASLYGGQAYDLENFEWASSDSSVASVNSSRNNCVVTANRNGTARITATHPLAPYPYNFIAYCRSDEFNEPYLTTGANVITMNRSVNPLKAVSVSVVNPYRQVAQQNFSWEVASEGNPAVSVSGNGDTALITALDNGLALVRASYADCQWPLDILVRVTSTVENVYVVPSVTALDVIGSSNVYTVSAQVEGYQGYADPEGFTWDVPEEAGELMDWEASGNTFSLTGKKNGMVKIRVGHSLSDFSRPVLLILSKQDGSAIDASMFITTSSNYVRTKVGAEPTPVSVTLSGGLPGDEQNISWAVNSGSDNEVVLIETNTGTVRPRAAGSFAYGNLYITPRAPGSAAIVVSHPKIAYSTEILVKVYSEHAQLEEPAYITSASSLVRILNGQSREVTANLAGNITAGDENGISWASSDQAVISVSPATGPAVVFSALGSGARQTYVTLSHAKAPAEKQILALSADTQEALDAMKGFYADTTYYRINEGGTAQLSLTPFGLAAGDSAAIQWTSGKPAVAIIASDPANRLNAAVTGISPGTASVTASLQGAAPVTFHVTVLPAGEPVDTILPQYLTATRNAVLLPEPDAQALLTVTGVNITPYDMTATSWTTDDASVAAVHGSGNTAAVTAVAAGKTSVRVSNPQSSNSLVIDVKVGALYEWEETFAVHISTSTDIVHMVKGEHYTLGAALVNTTAQSPFTWQKGQGAGLIEITGSSSGTCYIEALEAGMAEITVNNPLALTSKEVLVVISNTREELSGFAYLTTKQNVVTVGRGQTANVSLSVMGVSTPVISGYGWQSNNPAIVSLTASGQMAVLHGVSMGTTKIVATNDVCTFPLEIIVNCVDPVSASNNPYIMSPNIQTITVGDAATTITAELIGGLPSDAVSFTWDISDPSIAALYANNDTAQIRALREGVTQIVVRHPKANGVDRTILVICEPRLAADYYITTTESIIRMSPADSTRTLTVSLVNGSANDAYTFKWWADSYESIALNYAGASATVTPLATGSTTIHVSHPKAQFNKDIIIYVSQYSELAFASSSIDIQAGTQTFVSMRVPASTAKTRLSYSAALPGGGSASSIVSASGTNSVCIIDAHAPGTAVITASLVSVNSGAVQATAELLVNVSPSSTPPTYINYPGSTIITLEKGVTRSLSAVLSGLNATEQDSLSLQWVSSNQSALRLSPVSASGTAANKEVQVTAVQAGQEATVTISHEKASSNVILYFIIPGEETATVTLSRNHINMMLGEGPQTLSAAIRNGEQDDTANLEWTVEQETEAVKIAGSGKQINILPNAVGEAAVTVRVPSSGRTETCTVTVEEPRSIILGSASVVLFPTEERNITYVTTPAQDMAGIQWTVNDSAYAAVVDDDHNGAVTIVAKKEGATFITGTTPGGATAKLNVTVRSGDTFTINKSRVRSAPVYAGNENTFTVGYSVSPAIAEVRVTITDSAKLKLLEGTYSSYDPASYTYIITSALHENANSETGVATGSIRFVPLGETTGAVALAGFNRLGRQNNAGDFIPYSIATRSLAMEVYYSAYQFMVRDFTRSGNFSRFDSGIAAFVIGDGETVTFTPFAPEENANPVIITVEPAGRITTDQAPGRPAQADQITVGWNAAASTVTIRHNTDYKPGNYYGSSPYYNNDVVLAVPQVYMVTIKYDPFGPVTEKTYSFPLYVEVRNCPMNYSN
jgi:hypothetical protein